MCYCPALLSHGFRLVAETGHSFRHSDVPDAFAPAYWLVWHYELSNHSAGFGAVFLRGHYDWRQQNLSGALRHRRAGGFAALAWLVLFTKLI